MPWRVTGRERTRGSPVSGASTRSSSETRCAFASASSSSSVGLRPPDSSRDRVLTEIPVSAERSARVASRSRRSWRSRGPTRCRAAARSSSVTMPAQFASTATMFVNADRPSQTRGHDSPQLRLPPAEYDVVVVGGGAAGAQRRARARPLAPLGAGRRRRRARATPRPRHAHNYLGREGVAAPRAARDRPRGGAPVRRPRRSRRTSTRSARRTAHDPGFTVTTDDGRERRRPTGARRPPGSVDVLPDVPGLAEHWGRDVLHCPYCHGWEVRDQRVVVLATGPMATHQALLFRQLTDQVTVVVNDPAAHPGERRPRAARRPGHRGARTTRRWRCSRRTTR